ncbi:MAG: hypothetical protein EOO20_05375 [Chryseobacterium sp.]|nr:MAG: hypothetical protein EOO20_05375 [Chryseobacterium sp.]
MRISSVSVTRFSQYDIEDFEVNDSAIEYQSDFNIKVLPDFEEISIESTVKLYVKELAKYFGELKLIIKFSITPFGDVIKSENNGFEVPDLLVINLFNIIAGTIRGILYEKLRGTVLQNEVFPLIDVRELLKNKIN